MVAHDDVAAELPAVADDRLLETVYEPTSVRIVAGDLLPCVAPRHHVIDGTPKLDQKSPSRVQSLDPSTDRSSSRKQKIKGPAVPPRARQRTKRVVLRGADDSIEVDDQRKTLSVTRIAANDPRAG